MPFMFLPETTDTVERRNPTIATPSIGHFRYFGVRRCLQNKPSNVFGGIPTPGQARHLSHFARLRPVNDPLLRRVPRL
jgi:hypothetical protein